MISKTNIEGVLVFEPKVYEDHRGYFFESFNAKIWSEEGINTHFVQDNESRSMYGTVRGLHYQVGASAQAKLIRVTSGKVRDIVVDIRPDSPTYGAHYSIELSGDNRKQLYVPRGMAHGFATLSESAVFNYKCDNYYNKESEGGIKPLDASLSLDWGLESTSVILSEKDLLAPDFGMHKAYHV